MVRPVGNHVGRTGQSQRVSDELCPCVCAHTHSRHQTKRHRAEARIVAAQPVISIHLQCCRTTSSGRSIGDHYWAIHGRLAERVAVAIIEEGVGDRGSTPGSVVGN